MIEKIYKQFVQENDTDTVETERAMEAAVDNDNLIDLIGAAAESKLYAGFFAGFRAAMQLMMEVAR